MIRTSFERRIQEMWGRSTRRSGMSCGCGSASTRGAEDAAGDRGDHGPQPRADPADREPAKEKLRRAARPRPARLLELGWTCDQHPCPTCGGTGFEIVAREGREFAQACACRQVSAHAALGAVAGCRSEALRALHARELRAGQLLALRRAREGDGLLLGYPHLGPTRASPPVQRRQRRGKTHLAVAVLRELVENKGARGQFWDFHELIREIKASYDPETKTTELMVLEPVVEADVLLLDDLGRGR